MGRKYNHNVIVPELRKATTLADLVKTIDLLVQIFKVGMIQCAQLGFCPIRCMKWSIVDKMIKINKPTREKFFCQFCGAYWRKLYGQSNTEEYVMSEWRQTFETTLPGQISSPCNMSNKYIKILLLHQYPTLKKLIKYKHNDIYILHKKKLY